MKEQQHPAGGAVGEISRRDFIRRAGLLTAAVVFGPAIARGNAFAVDTSPRILPRRPYGREHLPLSVIGFDGILVAGVEKTIAGQRVAEAIERGVNYFDVTPQRGDAEIKLGAALQPYRTGVFLAGRTSERTRAGAAADLKRTLERLRTDHLDLYQLHALVDLQKDVDAAFGKSGALETLVEAKQAGVIRHLGFSAHSMAAALLAMNRYDFDSILFPINFATWFKNDFGPSVIAEAQARGVTVLAQDMLCRQRWPENDPNRHKYSKCWYQPVIDRHEAELAVRFALGQPVAAALSPGEESLFRLSLDLAADFRPLTGAERSELKEFSATLTPIFSHCLFRHGRQCCVGPCFACRG